MNSSPALKKWHAALADMHNPKRNLRVIHKVASRHAFRLPVAKTCRIVKLEVTPPVPVPSPDVKGGGFKLTYLFLLLVAT